MAALLMVCALGAVAAFAAVTWEGRLARLAQRHAEEAQAAEKVQRIAAEAAQVRESKERALYQGLTASLLRDRALRHCDEGDVGRGLLWLAESLRLVPENDRDLARAIHTNLAGWQEQLHPLRALLEHPGHVVSAAWSPDGRLVLTACTDRHIRLWKAASGQLNGKPLRLPRGVARAAFSPDGKMILTVAGQEVRLWRLGTNEPALLENIELGKGSEFVSHAFSQDGLQLWIAFRRGQATWLQAWRSDAHPSLAEPVELGQGLTQVVFSPDGQSFVTAGETREVIPRLWRSATGKPVRDLNEHTHRVFAIVFNPKDGRSFLTGSYDNTCRLWDTGTGEPLRAPLHHPVPARSVALSPNGRMILTGCIDGSAQFWDVIKGTAVGAPVRHPDAVGPVEFSSNGKFALTVSWDQVRIWDASTGEAIGAPLPHQTEVLAAAFAPDGKSVLTRCRDNQVRIWQTDAVRPASPRLAHASWVTAVAFEPPAEESLLTGIAGSEGKVLSWNVASPRQGCVELEGIGPVLSMACQPGGRIVAVGTRTREVWLRGPGEGRLERAGPLKLDDRIWSLAFSPDGKTLLAGIEKRRAEFWDVATRTRLPGALEHDKAVYAVAYSPDGRTVLTGSGDMTARLWDAATRQPVGTPLVHEGTVNAVAFQPPDGKLALTGSADRTARMWETSTGRPVGESLQHSARVLAVAFSRDGRIIATGCGDGTAHLWDALTGHPIGYPLRHHGAVRAVAFGLTPKASTAGEQGSIVVTASEDKTARIWDVPVPSTESVERIMLSLQVANGLELDAQGIARSLGPAAWQRLGRELHALVPARQRPSHEPARSYGEKSP
jgi:WD40 repeat protein